jgi:hypothetical protein
MKDNEYNNKCNKYFHTDLLDKYNIHFYSNNELNFIILNSIVNDNKNEIWATCNICCSYDIEHNFLLRGNDMIIIEKSIIDNKILFDDKKIKNIDDLENQIKKQIFDNEYIGYIKSTNKNIVYYYLIKEIIKS